jgi:hypothetical protein
MFKLLPVLEVQGDNSPCLKQESDPVSYKSPDSPRHPSRWIGSWPKTWRSNYLFLTLSLAVCFTVIVIAIWPTLRDIMREVQGRPIGREMTAFLRHSTERFVIALAMFCGFSYFYCSCVQAKKLFRTLVLAGVILFLVGLIFVNHLVADHVVAQRRMAFGQPVAVQKEIVVKTVHENEYLFRESTLQQLRLIDRKAFPLDSFEIREKLRQVDIKTFADLHREVMDIYSRDESGLIAKWCNECGGDEKKRKTLFIMNFVSGMWNFGNKHHTDKGGCVCGNEENAWQEQQMGVDDYLRSKIACCTDYTCLAKSLLDDEGIENRFTMISGHFFNEVYLGDHWCIADATVNIFVDKSWDDLYNLKDKREPITILLFPHSNMADENSPRFRPLVGVFRQAMLMRIAYRPEHFRESWLQSMPSQFD